MKHLLWLTGALTSTCVLTAICAHAQEIPAGYHLIWADEFNTDGPPDPKNWSFDTQANRERWWHDEAQYYSANRPENARVENGHLVIEARHEDMSDMPDSGGQNYSSARLQSKGKAEWTYGFFDIRAKLPCGVGQWPAIWMIGDGQWPQTGEIDIMEEIGFEPTTIYGTLHSTYSESAHVHQGSKLDIPTLCTAFHNYQADWTPQGLTLLVDGKAYYHLDRPANSDEAHYPFTTPEFMLLNVAVGGGWGGQHGIDNAALPAQMQVDYVRVYQK